MVRAGEAMRIALIVLNALVAGGCVALWLVRSVLMRVFAAVEPQGGEAGNPATAEQVWESIAPLYGAYGVALAVLLGISCCCWAVGRLRAGRGTPG